jgi:hypothetical protein
MKEMLLEKILKIDRSGTEKLNKHLSGKSATNQAKKWTRS